MAKYLVETDGGNYEVETQDSPMQPALDMAGTALGVGGQAAELAYKHGTTPIGKLALAGVGKIGQGYDWLKKQYLNSPINPIPKLMSDKPMIEGNMPIKQFKGGKLEETGNVPISESPQSIMKHLQSLGIDVALGAGAKGKIDEFNEPSNMLTRASKAVTEKESLTSEILRPPKGDMYDDIVKYASDEITPSKTYGELTEKLGQTKDSLMNQRNYKLASSKKRIGEEYLKPLNQLYGEMTKDPQLASKAEPLAMAINKEYEYLFSKPDRKISLVEAQQRKESLQTMTKSLLESGGADISDPALKQAWDKIRYGFKESIERAEPEIEALNKPYGGLNEATELSEKMRVAAQNEGPHTWWKDILSHVIRPSKAGTTAALAREAFRQETNLLGKTKKIQKLSKKAETLRELASQRINRGK